MLLLLLTMACKDPTTVDSVTDDSAADDSAGDDTTVPEDFTFSTPAWEDGAEIPAEFTCDGAGGWNNQRNPELVWSEPPDGTLGYAVIYVDESLNDWRHWAFFTDDPSLTSIPQETSNTEQLPAGVTELVSGDGRRGYVPNCPSGQEHTYTFTIWALSQPLALDEGASFGQLRNAAESNSLESLSFSGLSAAGG